jgi:hypothetical protein
MLGGWLQRGLVDHRWATLGAAMSDKTRTAAKVRRQDNQRDRNTGLEMQEMVEWEMEA